MNFAVGSLVRARNREWIVLPESKEDILILRPLGGSDEEITGIYLPLEKVIPASFSLPDPEDIGDYTSCRLLRDAVQLSFRSSTGPFRSFARISVEPRPYQLVPLLMALKLDPVRLLIADDVGVGKTIEACLIIRELLDRGEINRMAILCPPQLAEQWQYELEDKFHIKAELVLPSTVKKLERGLGIGESLFDVYPFVIVSTDYIKSTRRCDEFIRSCPECVVVDEAHTCATAMGSKPSHQRFRLLTKIAENQNRHLILLTATPHSGKEEVFRSLLGFLKPEFKDLPEDLSGKENEPYRRKLAQHFVQRRRGDIRYYLKANTPFPERESYEYSYNLSPAYKKLMDKVLAYARKTIDESDTDLIKLRIKWWSMLALLRSLASSPVAAAATLRTRAATMDAETLEEVDEVGRRTVLDLMIEDTKEGLDVVPGGDTASEDEANKRKLLALAKEAEVLAKPHVKKDNKLAKATEIIKQLINDGFNPIVFCRFIPTAEYVAEHLRDSIPGVEVGCVTGTLPPQEREERVNQLAKAKKRILVCTDCLSEGINLQQYFNSVFHYDLSWNPTRHEQREGRVDRFGQLSSRIRTITYYGVDNYIDGLVLEVLIRKHKTIRNSLGISVPVPLDSDKVIEAILEGLLLKGKTRTSKAIELMLPGLEEKIQPQKQEFFNKWDKLVEREKKSRTLFAQHSIKPDEVFKQLQAAKQASGTDVKSFTLNALKFYDAAITPLNKEKDIYEIDFSLMPRSLKEKLMEISPKKIGFHICPPSDVEYISRTHPFVQTLTSHILEEALNKNSETRAKRCGAIRTRAVKTRTTLLILRLRFNLLTKFKDYEKTLFAEECQVVAFSGPPEKPQWLDRESALSLLSVEPDDIIYPEQAISFVSRVVSGYKNLIPYIEKIAYSQAQALEEANLSVRESAKIKGIKYKASPLLPVDVIGIYVFLPVLNTFS